MAGGLVAKRDVEGRRLERVGAAALPETGRTRIRPAERRGRVRCGRTLAHKDTPTPLTGFQRLYTVVTPPIGLMSPTKRNESAMAKSPGVFDGSSVLRHVRGFWQAQARRSTIH